ncbi:MAG TPA: TadE/TadG family type IV pilus assembly protein [Methylophilus sp.]
MKHYSKSNKQNGVAAVEFALLLPILLLLAFGVVEFGRFMYQYNSLAKAVRDSTRFLAATSPTLPGYSTYEAEALCLAVYASTACSGSPVADGLTADNVNIAYSTVGTMSVVTVSIINYQANFIEGYIPTILGLGDGIGFGNISVSMRQVS